MNNIEKIAKEILASPTDSIAKKVFDDEYKNQIINTLETELMELQVKLSKHMMPWVKKRFNDYNVQRYVDKYSEEDKAKIEQEINKLVSKLMYTALGTSKLKQF